MILTSLIYCLTHNRHAPARDNNNPTIHLATEHPRHMCSWEPTRCTHQTFVVMRRRYGFLRGVPVANPRSRTVRGEFHRLGIDRRRAMFYFVAEKWHSVTPPNLGSRCIALAKPTNRNKRSSTSQAITCTVGFASVIR